MPESGAQERTEDATPHRRQEARKKGTVAKSTDLTSSLALLAAIVVGPTAFEKMLTGWEQGFNSSVSMAPTDISFSTIYRQAALSIGPSLGGFALLVATVMVVGIAISTAQVGFVLSGEALIPKFDKMNPITGFQRLFSANIAVDALKALAKSIFFALITFAAISASWEKLINLGYLSPLAGLQVAVDSIRTLAIRTTMLWIIISAVDYFIQKKRIDKQLKMSKEEIKQEMKQMEQSPELKMAMAIKRRKFARSRMMSSVKNADVIITNPSHFAIAIKYDSLKNAAPVVVAKGADLLAAKIRELAEQNEIPIVPNPPLARALYRQCEVGDPIPRDLFQPVAEILAYVYKTLHRLRNQAA